MDEQLQRFVHSSTARLGATYLAIIMLMSIGFSIVFYNTSSHALNRQVPTTETVVWGAVQIVRPNTGPNTVRDFLSDRADEGRHDLILRLIAINIITLIVGAGISYILARRTLAPIEANMEAQRRFVSDASHELRTPLTAIQTSNDVALRDKKLTLKDAKAVIADNTIEVTKLRQLSDALLGLARDENHTISLEHVKLHGSVQAAINQIIPAAQMKRIAVEDAVADLTVSSNQNVLSQILVVLLDNAIKYSPKESTVHLDSTLKGAYVYLHVRDEGMGIRESDLPHVFRRFYRADAARTDSHQDGYGLGLSIAQGLAKTHGAGMSVQSEVNKGSVFTIKLPLAK